MNRNLLPLTLFGVGFLMLYSGYKNLHPIDGVLKPILRGDPPGAIPLTGNVAGKLDPNTPWAGGGKGWVPGTDLGGSGGSTSKFTDTPTPPPPGAASGSSSGSGVVNA